MNSLPVLSGRQLARLLEKDGWQRKRKSRHGIYLSKVQGSDYIPAIIPDKPELKGHILNRILSKQQTCLGREGLARLIEKYGK